MLPNACKFLSSVRIIVYALYIMLFSKLCNYIVTLSCK